MKSRKSGLLEMEKYDPNGLIDHLIQTQVLKNDAALSRLLCFKPTVISKIRNKRLPITSYFLIRAHEKTGLSISVMRSMMGVHRDFYE